MSHVYYGQHGLTQVLVNSIRLQDMDFVTERAAVKMKIASISLILVTMIRMLWNVYQENVKISNVIVI